MAETRIYDDFYAFKWYADRFILQLEGVGYLDLTEEQAKKFAMFSFKPVMFELERVTDKVTDFVSVNGTTEMTVEVKDYLNPNNRKYMFSYAGDRDVACVNMHNFGVGGNINIPKVLMDELKKYIKPFYDKQVMLYQRRLSMQKQNENGNQR